MDLLQGKGNLSKGKSHVVAIILGKAAQHQALRERDPSEGLVPDKLVALCNEYCRYLKNRTKKRVLLLVDHVDKMRSETAARETLIDAVSHWGRLNASLASHDRAVRVYDRSDAIVRRGLLGKTGGRFIQNPDRQRR